ncbi:PREDICTED: putative RNA exonuclease pqe-1 [Bactrocera latifrons]|uniref:putative RNA exonuclease pqe-1 n=1 Tax=Bactrocera latifrons TaxID=174628 RepID=UPI0008DD27E0|nr:PREDICTED: putative RNA exonuclease pqe-1 [Bactrocera latifrons]
MKAEVTCTWQIPRWDGKKQQKMSFQTQILDNELIGSLQNRHLEEEVRAKHMLQKRHLEEQLKAKRELQTRNLEEQLRVMHTLQKKQLEEELREKRLLQERQIEEELRAKESLQKRHLEEELSVKELILNRKRILRKQRCESKKQTSKHEQPQKLQENQTKVQLEEDIEKLDKQQSQENLKREKLKELLKQEIRKLKQEIQLEKLKKANDSEEIQKKSIVHSKHSLSEADFVKHLRRHIIEAKLRRCHGYPVERVTHDGCVEIHKYLPDHVGLSECVTDNGVTVSSSSSSFSVISETIDSNVDDLAIPNKDDKDQYHTQLDEFSTISITEKHKSKKVVSTSTNSSFSVISDTKDDLTILNKGDRDQNQIQLVEFGPIPWTEKHTSPRMSCSSSSFSVISETNDNNVDGFIILNEFLRKDCVRCGRPFYVNELGEYLNRERCTYHWGKLHYAYKGKRVYIPQYTCCEGNKGSEGCARHPLHIWSGILDGVNGPYHDFLRTRACCKKTGDVPKVYALQCKTCITGRGLEVTKVMLMSYDGQLVYDQYVQPTTDIVDYWMYYSDKSRTDTLESRSFKRLGDVQQDLLELIDEDAILIGHCLEHELRVLRILHNNIVDIAIEFAHPLGLFPGRSLQNLAEIYLKRSTQGDSEDNDSLEDMRICLELMKWRVREDKRQTELNP